MPFVTERPEPVRDEMTFEPSWKSFSFTPVKVEVAVVEVATKYWAPTVGDSMPPEYVVVPELAKRLRPEKVFESESSVDEAKVQVEVEKE